MATKANAPKAGMNGYTTKQRGRSAGPSGPGSLPTGKTGMVVPAPNGEGQSVRKAPSHSNPR